MVIMIAMGHGKSGVVPHRPRNACNEMAIFAAFTPVSWSALCSTRLTTGLSRLAFGL